MTYKYNKEQHTAKIKAGLETAKKKGKKLGRPKGGKIKGEEMVIAIYECYFLKKTSFILNNPTIMKRLLKSRWSNSQGLNVEDYGCGPCNEFDDNNNPTYKDIANEAHLSKSTVQKIINKYKGK